MTLVLGHERVLDEGAGDPRRRVTEHRDGRIVGAAAYEPLYGPAAEVAVALEDPAEASLAARLVERVAEIVRDAGLHTMRFALGTEQEALAVAILGVPVHGGEATIRLDPAGHSVLNTEPDEQAAPMTPERVGPTIDS